MRPRSFLLAVAASVALAGCSLVGADGGLHATVRPPVIELRNDTGGAVRYYVGDEDALALIDLDLDPSRLPSVAAGETAEVPFAAIGFYSEDTRRLWIWWVGEGGEGGTLRTTIE